jgi:uncharacterized protein YidB (DUF937 family)
MAIVRKLVLAALGILAYQSREKIGNLLRGNKQRSEPGVPQSGLIDELTEGSTALGDILDKFRDAGSSEKVDSWIRQGPNRPIQPSEVEAAIDVGTLAALSRQTGLSREELIERITQRLPKAVDAMTPAGVWPAALSDKNLRDLLGDAPSGSFGQSNSAQPTPMPARESGSQADRAFGEPPGDADAEPASVAGDRKSRLKTKP